MAGTGRCEDALQHPGFALGEWHQRKLGFAALRVNGSLRDELLDGEIFYSLVEAKVPIEAWRRHYNTIRPHSSLGYRPPAPEAAAPPLPPPGSASLHLQTAMATEAIMH